MLEFVYLQVIIANVNFFLRYIALKQSALTYSTQIHRLFLILIG